MVEAWQGSKTKLYEILIKIFNLFEIRLYL